MLSTYLVLIQKLNLVPMVLSYPPRENHGNEVDRSSGERGKMAYKMAVT